MTGQIGVNSTSRGSRVDNADVAMVCAVVVRVAFGERVIELDGGCFMPNQVG